MADDRRVEKRLRIILQALLPKDASSAKTEKCLSYAKKIINSSIGQGGLGDPTNAVTTDRVASAIKKALVISDRGDRAKPLRFSELAGEYLQKRSLKHPRQPLVFLYAMRGVRISTEGACAAPAIDEGMQRSMDVAHVLPLKQQGIVGKKRKAEVDGDDKGFESEEQRKQRERAEESALLLRDVVSSLQGIDTDRVRFTAEGTINVVAQYLEPKTIVFAREIAECGLLFRRISYIADSLCGNGGSAMLSFGAAVRDELSSLRRLYAVIDSQQPDLTFHRVLVWVQEPLRKLRVLLEIAEQVVDPNRAVAVGTIVHSYVSHGDPLVDTLVETIARKVARPVHREMVEWMLNGTLCDDPDFFVRTFEGGEFYIDRSLVPSYIPPALAKDVLLAGKTAHMIRNVCNESSWVLDEKIQTLLSKEGTEYGDDMEPFARAAAAAARNSGRHLMDLMNSAFHVMDHAYGIRQYVLLGQGDFAQNLVDSLASDLSRPAAMLFRHNLVPFLDAAIRASNARYSPKYVLDSLDISLVESSSPERPGWEKFNLTYVVDGPIALIFTPLVMRGYSELFAAAWRVTRAEYELENAWRRQSGNARALRALPEAFSVSLKMDALCAEMAHFLSSFKQFVNADVIESCWKTFASAAEANKDSFDELVAAHSTFLNDVLRLCLITPESLKTIESGTLVKKSVLHKTFDSILKTILAFCSFQEAFYTSTFQEFFRKRTLAAFKGSENDNYINEEEEEEEDNNDDNDDEDMMNESEFIGSVK